MSPSKLRVAVISAGRMASTIDDEIRSSEVWPSLKSQLPYSHAPCYKTFDEVEIVAVSDLIEEKCKAFCQRWHVPRHYRDYREMIDVEKPDIVSIATPAGLHAEMAIFAMEHGVRGIYCEKAMCCSLAEADAIIKCVERYGVTFVLGAQRRHHPHFKKARELVESGEIGELIGVTSWLESALLHSLSHAVDGSLYLAGDATAEWVFGVLGPARSLDLVEKRRIAESPEYDPQSWRWSGDPGCLTYTARLTDGAFISHLPAVTDLRWEIVCTNGYIRIVDNNNSLRLFKRHGRGYSFDSVPLEKVAPASSHVALVEDLLRCMRTHEKPLANEMVARNGMEILMGCAASHQQGGCKVQLPLADRGMYIPSH